MTRLPCPASCLDLTVHAMDMLGEGGGSLPYLQGRTARGSAVSAAQLRKQPLLEGFVSESIAGYSPCHPIYQELGIFDVLSS